MSENQDPLHVIKMAYEPLVRVRHPSEAARWPVLTGADIKIGSYKGWLIVFLKHTGNPNMTSRSGQGELKSGLVGADAITLDNLEAVRDRLLRHYRATLDDALVMVPPSGALNRTELELMMARHEAALGIAKMKIFLSHKTHDKAMVRDFKRTLETLGLDPWLDEDAMAAGAQLDRAILKGMQDSCAAVFFITPNFVDEAFLAFEINYAIAQQRSRPQQFAIITLVFEESGQRPNVPDLLRPFVWKEPSSSLQGLQEIIRALPIKLGAPHWR
ncbi:MAG TPA: toll/interleukin-1 receptor domain-containing protein [Novosphingobium sp.]|nr:toll/interleukin-1 receptor domain-containing protein [Novosphingobium sp.]